MGFGRDGAQWSSRFRLFSRGGRLLLPILRGDRDGASGLS